MLQHSLMKSRVHNAFNRPVGCIGHPRGAAGDREHRQSRLTQQKSAFLVQTKLFIIGTEQLRRIRPFRGSEQEDPFVAERIMKQLNYFALDRSLEIDQQVPAGDEI